MDKEQFNILPEKTDGDVSCSTNAYDGLYDSLPIIDVEIKTQEVIKSEGTTFFDIKQNSDYKKRSKSLEEDNDELKRELKYQFQMDHKFFGSIVSINLSEEKFTARAKRNTDLTEIELVFSFNSIPNEEREKIEVGKNIIYVLGKQYTHGTAQNTSKLYLRNNPKWSRKEIEKMNSRAEKLFKLLGEFNDHRD